MGHSVCVWVCTGRGGWVCVYESREAFVCTNREGMGHGWMRGYFSTGLWFVISAISYVYSLCWHNRAHDFKSDLWVSFSNVSLVGLSPKMHKDSLYTSAGSDDSYWNSSLCSRVRCSDFLLWVRLKEWVNGNCFLSVQSVCSGVC